MSEDFIKRQIH